MIAEFPDSTPISLDVRIEFNAFVGRYLPYAEFNFVNLASWNRHNQGAVSLLNGNLVLRFPSYVHDGQFVTLLGQTKPITTARILLNYTENGWAARQLELVPEPVAKRLSHAALEVSEDHGNHDYVLSFPKLIAMQGHELHRFRRAIRTFARLYGNDAKFVTLDICEPGVQAEVIDVFMRREMSKQGNDWTNEIAALTQLFMYARHCQLITYGLRLKGKLQAFMIAEMVGRQWSVGQFWKADTTYNGIYSYLLFRVASNLMDHGITKMNIQQDLGIESLRFFKLSLGPVTHLKKYQISLRAAAEPETHGAQLHAQSRP